MSEAGILSLTEHQNRMLIDRTIWLPHICTGSNIKNLISGFEGSTGPADLEKGDDS